MSFTYGKICIIRIPCFTPPHFVNLFALTPLVNIKHFLIYTLSFSLYYISTLTPTYSITSYGNTIFD